jgi:hypothetical protein
MLFIKSMYSSGIVPKNQHVLNVNAFKFIYIGINMRLCQVISDLSELKPLFLILGKP